VELLDLESSTGTELLSYWNMHGVAEASILGLKINTVPLVVLAFYASGAHAGTVEKDNVRDRKPWVHRQLLGGQEPASVRLLRSTPTSTVEADEWPESRRSHHLHINGPATATAAHRLNPVRHDGFSDEPMSFGFPAPDYALHHTLMEPLVPLFSNPNVVNDDKADEHHARSNEFAIDAAEYTRVVRAAQSLSSTSSHTRDTPSPSRRESNQRRLQMQNSLGYPDPCNPVNGSNPCDEEIGMCHTLVRPPMRWISAD
jgi:hypothetical protein